MPAKYQAPTVKKAFQILKIISDSQAGEGISDLSKILKLSKSTVHGITSALEDTGAIIRDAVTKKYSLGITLFELGRAAYSQTYLKDIARPILEALIEKTQETVFLGVLNREYVTILDTVESSQDLKITSPIGTTITLLAGAAGKVFLASMEEARAKEIIERKGLKKYTENSIIDPEKYLREIRNVRESGFATDYEEYILGVRAVCSPIGAERHLRSAIWVVGFKTSLDDEKMKVLINETKEAAEAITKKIQEQFET